MLSAICDQSEETQGTGNREQGKRKEVFRIFPELKLPQEVIIHYQRM